MMDKAKVISAYLRGFITLRECEQILGMDASFILGMVHDHRRKDSVSIQQPANH
jgi:ribosomal protein L13E